MVVLGSELSGELALVLGDSAAVCEASTRGQSDGWSIHAVKFCGRGRQAGSLYTWGCALQLVVASTRCLSSSI